MPGIFYLIQNGYIPSKLLKEVILNSLSERVSCKKMPTGLFFKDISDLRITRHVDLNDSFNIQHVYCIDLQALVQSPNERREK
jgi:hypothetical protein